MAATDASIHARYDPSEIVVLLLAPSMEEAEELREVYHASYPCLADSGSAVYWEWRIPDAFGPYPQDYLVDPSGNVAYWANEYRPQEIIDRIDRMLGKDFVLETSPDPMQGGEAAQVRISDASHEVPAYVAYSLYGPGSTFVPALGVILDLDRPVLSPPSKVTDQLGQAQWTGILPSPPISRSLWIQAAQPGRVSEVVATELVP